MLIEKIATERLIPADYNPRKDLKPGDPEYEKLKRSLEEFGYVEPIIWNKTTGHIVGGHQRISIFDTVYETKNYKLRVSAVDLDDKQSLMALLEEDTARAAG